MKFARLLAAVVLGALTLTSCSDDPFVPTGSYVAPEYHATLQSLNTPFSSVCGAGDNDIYAVGAALLHYDGSNWKPMAPPPFDLPWESFAVAFDNGDVVISRGWGDLYVRSEDEWNQIGSPGWSVRDLWGTSSHDLYALTYNGVYHYEGAAWDSIAVSRSWEIGGMAADQDGHLIMCGEFGRIDRFNGTDWTSTYLDSMIRFHAVAVTPSGKTFVADYRVIYTVTGNSLNPILDSHIWGAELRTDGETLYAAGDGPYSGSYRIGAYQNGSWKALGEGNGRLQDFWVGTGQVAGVGQNFIWHGTPSGGAPVAIAPSHGEINDAVAIGDAIYTVGWSAYRFQNDTWTDLDKEYITPNPADGIDGRQPNDLYAVGRDMILHYDGAAWSWVNSGFETDLNAVWVEPNGNVVAVGSGSDGTAIVEYDGADWTKRDIPFESSGFTDVTGVGNTIFAVGGWGLIAIRKQNHWFLMRPTNATLTSVWGYDEKHVYAASTNDNEILFYDGSRWEPMAIEGPSIPRPVSIWGTSPGNIFVLDQDGTLAHFNGRSWSTEERIFSSNMRAVTGTAREVLTVGAYGSALYRK